MKVLFDTNVLVASLIATHERHEDSLRWVDQALTGKIQGLMSQHSMLELYAILTGMPSSPKVDSAFAKNSIDSLTSKLTIVDLDSADYRLCLQRAQSGGLRGGVVYDLLILHAAEKSEADALVTANLKHFQRLAISDRPEIRAL